MADDDEIDILGDFSFNSCFAQNNQGIPSCSSREDTVHPQWLLDSTETNWYDKKQSNRLKHGSPKKLYGNNSSEKNQINVQTTWSPEEKQLLEIEMAKYGRNVHKISQTLKTKTVAEIQALIDAEHGINLETPTFGLDKPEDHENVPAVAQEEIVTDDVSSINSVLNMVTTGTTTIPVPKKEFSRTNKKSKSLLKPDLFESKLVTINPNEILYEDDLIVGSTESIGSDMDLMDIVSNNIANHQAKKKPEKKIGNHRRKLSKNYDKNSTRNRSKELLKSPQRKQGKDSGMSEDNTKSAKMQIVLGSGQALPVSEGEQVIKIEKKKESESESDVEIDVDSDTDNVSKKSTPKKPRSVATSGEETPIAIPLGRFQHVPRRPKKLNLDGGGGYTIMHTESGDLYTVGTEPRRERPPKKQQVELLHCKVYNADKPAPFEVHLHVSALVLMDAHAHTSRAEVMGLLGGEMAHTVLVVRAYRPAASAAARTHCDMDPVSQSIAAESLRESHAVCGWHHSHPQFSPSPSAQDLTSQRALQHALEWKVPFLGFITSQHWPTGRTASQYRCIRVEEGDDNIPVGYQFSVKLVADITQDSLPTFLQELRGVMLEPPGRNDLCVDMMRDKCPQAGITYLNKCISSVAHHMSSAGYAQDDPLVEQLVQGIRDVFR